MRKLPIAPGVALALLFTCAVLATPARAALQRDLDYDEGVRSYGGNSDNLPVRPSLGWEEAVAWARKMPAVQLAMQTCAGRGYQALSAHDSAFIALDPPSTAVIFPYRRPGFALAQFQYGQPLLMVVTTLGHDGLPSTKVTAGVVILDAQNNAVFTADSLPQYAASDGSFDVVSSGGGEGGPGDKRYTVVPALPNWPAWFVDQKSGFNKFVRCWGIGSLTTCIRPLLNFTRSGGGTVILFTQPEDLGFYMAFCMLGTGLGCLWAVW
jgi:hypothetical protein